MDYSQLRNAIAFFYKLDSYVTDLVLNKVVLTKLKCGKIVLDKML